MMITMRIMTIRMMNHMRTRSKSMAKKIPIRQCIGCRQEKGKNEMVRVIRSPENEILIDTTGRMNGRGAYICKSAECLNKAIKTKSLSRALKAEIPDELYDTLSKELI